MPESDSVLTKAPTVGQTEPATFASPNQNADSSLQNNNLTKQINSDKMSPKKIVSFVTATLLIIIAGSFTGLGLAKVKSSSQKVDLSTAQTANSRLDLKVGDIIGSPDQGAFPDTAEGVLLSGGIDGEGSHHLERPGGPSQNVFLTSSILDLDQLTNHKVQVWGETFSAQKAGWLMDVGRAQILELNSQPPTNQDES